MKRIKWSNDYMQAFIYAFRRGGNLKNGPYQCTDCGETVKFTIENII